MDHVVADTPAAFREDDELADRHPAAAPPPRPHRADIDGLRAVSILLVVGYHAGLSWLPGGFVGVDVFFVLSGFLITGLLLAELAATDRIALGQFFARRARRLLPLSTLVLVATLLAGMVLLPPLARAGLVRDARAAALYVANWRFAGQATAYSDAEVTDSLLVHYWSLSWSCSTRAGRLRSTRWPWSPAAVRRGAGSCTHCWRLRSESSSWSRLPRRGARPLVSAPRPSS